MSYYYSNDSFDDELSTPGAGPSRPQPYVDETHSESDHTDESDEDVHLPRVRGPSVKSWPYAYIARSGHPNPYVPLPYHSFPGTYLEVPTPIASHARAQAAHWDDDNESTGAWPLPVLVPATHTYTEAAPHHIPVSTLSTLMSALEPIEVEEHPRMHCAAPFSSLLGAVYPIQGPWSEMAREIMEAPRNIILRVLAEVPPRVPVEEVPEPVPEPPPPPQTIAEPVLQEHHEDKEEDSRRKKVRVEKGSEGEGQGEGESQEGSRGGSSTKVGRRIVRRPRMPQIAGCGQFSVRLPSHYAARGGETVGARGQIPVVHPQAHGSALQRTTHTSTMSTHRVENPTGEPVPETVPQSIGGPSTATLGEEQRGARKRKRADPHVCDGTDGCSKRLSCPYDMPRHKATLRHGGERKFGCDDCQAHFVRKDEVHRHKRDHCPNRGRKHNGEDGPSQGPRRDGPESGEGGMGVIGNGLLSG